jgi:PadR family transcriptional regulator PadR
MDIQLKRGLLEVCVLAAIKNEDSYGYRIIKELSPFVEISESTLYPILRRLETGELLTVRTAEHNGRLRKYYRITERGKERLGEFKAEWAEIVRIYQFISQEDKGFEFRPIGMGIQNIPEIIAACEESGSEYLIVEQDQSVDRPALEAIEISRQYLKSIGQ